MHVGQLIGDRFELEELLGSGGMASVFRARDRRLDRVVALKVLTEELTDDPAYVERFRREAQAMARLAHPNVVTVIDHGEHEGRPYLVLEYVPGATLADVIRDGAPLPVERALGLAAEAARGVAFAHASGIVHRDVKPQNVILDERGTPKVADFGIARSVGADSTADTLTKTGTILGTSEYVAPEQVLAKRVDERSDQYSLGVLLYELLTGRAPFSGETFMEVATKHVSEPVPSVRTVRRDVPRRVDAVVQRALAKEPADRFSTVDAMIGALEVAIGEERDRVRRARLQLPPAAVGPFRRAPLAAAGALALAVLALVAALATGGGGGDDDDDAQERPARTAVARLVAVADHDPFGDDREEHRREVPLATDGDASTYWTTEGYSSFDKPGVGIVLDARRRVALAGLELLTDEPGFRARIQAGNRPTGGFRDVSRELTVAPRTRFRLDTGGESFRYYVVWITDPNGRARINEVRALRGS